MSKNGTQIQATPMQCDKGATIKVKATIKAHGDYNGVKQTIITRTIIL